MRTAWPLRITDQQTSTLTSRARSGPVALIASRAGAREEVEWDQHSRITTADSGAHECHHSQGYPQIIVPETIE
eukprot:74167-Hanusia_phi.AAC.2